MTKQILPWKTLKKKDLAPFLDFEQTIIDKGFVKDSDEAADAVLYFIACHQFAYKIDLEKLKRFDEFNFKHDYYGLARHMDKSTGKVGNHFVPRCAANQ